jgi:hypothetical protein
MEPGDELIYSGPWREADKIHEILSRELMTSKHIKKGSEPAKRISVL